MTTGRSTVAPHPFTPDPDIGPAHDGRLTCLTCRMLGRRDDARHTMPVVPEQAEHLRRYGEDL